jgi:nucleoside-diphosphate-sugar epimerase
MKRLAAESDADPLPFPIRGAGTETRAFTFIDDLVDGVMVLLARAEHLGIYHVGNPEEVAIRDAARLVGDYFGRAVEVVPGEAAAGATPRRCPDIGRLAGLGFAPRIGLAEGLPVLARWYDENAGLAPAGAAA